MEIIATKPSRRWQPPRVTSTTSLQLEHLVPLDAISQNSALESLAINRMITIHTIELEGSQTLSRMDILSPPRFSTSAMDEQHLYL
jgi:hypothetical protein